MPREKSAIDDLEELLAYRLPNSGKPMSSIVLPRARAEQLLREILELQIKAGDRV